MFLALQHISCEPPALYEDILLARGDKVERVEVGVCLGAQLLAAALGARAYPGSRPWVGIGEVYVTDATVGDPVFDGVPARFPTLQWHGDTFDLPGHVEVSPALAAEWAEVPAYAESLEQVHGAGAMPRLLEAVSRNAEATSAVATALFTNWLDRVVAR